MFDRREKINQAKLPNCEFCFQSIVSNEVPEHPCVSPSSNCVFERRLIEKYIAENGTDPISGEQISEEQLIDIKGKFLYIVMMRAKYLHNIFLYLI